MIRVSLLSGLMLAVLVSGVAVGSNHVTTLTTSLSGSEEVGGGDPNGKGFVTLAINSTTGEICYKGKVQAIGRAVTGAHIHVGAAGVNGGIVVDLDPFNAKVTGNKAEHCVTTSVAIARAMILTPSAYYVNVHTETYPGGAIRGQLGD